jgi:hypothetical protein
MGWSSGSELARETWDMVRPFINGKHKKRIAEKFLTAFENHDADDFDGQSNLEKDAGRKRDDDD